MIYWSEAASGQERHFLGDVNVSKTLTRTLVSGCAADQEHPSVNEKDTETYMVPDAFFSQNEFGKPQINTASCPLINQTIL